MSENRDERQNDAAATPNASAQAPAAATPSYGANATQPTLPLGQQTPADAHPTVPLQPRVEAPLFPAPIVTPQPVIQQQAASGYGQPYGAPQAGAHALPQSTPQVNFGAPAGYATQQQPGAAGGHTTQNAFGAAYVAPHTPGAAFTKPTAKKRSKAGMLAGALALVAVVGLGAGFGGAAIGNGVFSSTVAKGAATGPTAVTINNPDSVNAITAVSAKVLPSVVTLSVSGGQSSGSGSGVILSEDGYVLTNTHVVTLGGTAADASVRVTTSDGHIYKATIVGTDPTYDLAVVKLEGASGLTPIEWGDSTALNVGDQAIALGAPLGLDDTVTSGIVSALNRSISIQSSAVPEGQSDQTEQNSQEQNGSQSPFQFDLPGQNQQQTGATSTISISVIQTDAAINPGNSGGALVNSKGELIGINVAIATAGSGSTSSGESGNIGVGFSIPSMVAERVANEIIEGGSASHGRIGASVGSAANEADATIEGALIAKVDAGSPAEAAGLKAGDVVTEFNGFPIANATDLTAQVRALAAGAETTLTYNREGKAYETKITLAELK